MFRRLAVYIVALTLVLGGCAAQIQQPTRVCPGKGSTAEALSVLRSHCQSAAPLKAIGTCLLEYHVEGKQQPRRENFPVRVWLNPPIEIYLQGNVAFDPRGIVAGSNKDEFWLAIRLKEISSYWWGRWTEASQLDELVISPRVVLETLGATGIESAKGGKENWSLSNEGVFDVLIQRSVQGRVIKRIHVFCCDYSIRRIEYFGPDGELAVTAELDKYREVAESFSVPTLIKVVRQDGGANNSVSVTVTLTSVKSASFTEQQRDRLFTRPTARGFEHVLMNVGGAWVEQQ
jgi:hypothetical protein